MLGKIGNQPAAAGSAFPSPSGIQHGAICARPTPGNGVYFNGAITLWNAGQRGTLASGNSADIPAEPAGARIDVLLDNNTWISGASGSEVTMLFPSITAGRTWIAAIIRRAGDGSVVREHENGTNSFIYAINFVTHERYHRFSTTSANSTATSPTYIGCNSMPIRAVTGGMYYMTWSGMCTHNTANGNVYAGANVDGTGWGFGELEYSAGRGPMAHTGTAGGTTSIYARIPLATGTHQIQVNHFTGSGTLSVKWQHMILERLK